MKLHKILCIAICIALLLTIMGCSQQAAKNDENVNQDSGKANNNQDQEEIDPFGKYDPPIDVWTIHTGTDGAFWFPEGDSIENNIYTRTWEEQLGIRIKYKWTCPGSQAQDKMNVMIASGDLPDVFSVDRNTFERLCEAGALEDLKDVVDKYASPFMKKCLSGTSERAVEEVTRDGKMYGIPNIMSFEEGSNVIWIRVDWLNNLGLELPKTADELFKVMDAFVNNDPDKNGKNDTYAIGTYKGNPGKWIGDIFWNMFHSYPDIWVMNDSGTLEHGMFGPSFSDNTKKAIATLQDFYKKGYLHPDFATLSFDQFQEEMLNNKFGIIFGDVWGAYWPLVLHVQKYPDADWAPLPVFSVDDQPAKVSSEYAGWMNILVVRKGFEHPEALVKMCNLYHKLNNDPETMQFAEYNTNPEDNNQIFLCYPLLIYDPLFNRNGYIAVSKALETKDPSGLCEAYKLFYDQIISYIENKDPVGWTPYRTYTAEGSEGITDYYIKNKMHLLNEFTGSPLPSMIEKMPNIYKAFDEMFCRVVLGESIDLFDEFLNQYEKLGGKEIEKDVNAWFENQGKKSINEWYKSYTPEN